MKRFIRFLFMSAVVLAVALPVHAQTQIYVNDKLNILSQAKSFTGTVGQYFSANFSVSGGVPTYNWSVNSGSLPPGLEILFPPAAITNCMPVMDSLSSGCGYPITTGETLTIGGTPIKAGSFQFKLLVTDANSKTGTAEFTVVIASSENTDPGQQIQVSSPAANATWYPGKEYSIQWKGPATFAPVKVNISVSKYIACLYSNPRCLIAEPPAEIIGTADLSDNKFVWKIPSTQAPGLALVRVAAVDGSLNGTSGAFTIAETDNRTDTMLITTTASPRVVLGKSYMGVFNIIGGKPPYQMRVASGQLPPGLTLQVNSRACPAVIGVVCPPDMNESYFIYGTPARLGTYTFTLLATDSSLAPTSASAKKEFSITVHDKEDEVLPVTDIKPGMVVIAPGTTTVYYITSDLKKYGFTSFEDFISRGFTFSQIQRVDKTALDRIPEVSQLERTGNITFKYNGKPAIYYLTKEKCKQVYPSMTAFRAWDVQIGQVITMPEGEQFPDCSLHFVRLPENFLAKLENDSTVFVIRGGKRVPFASYEAFVREGFVSKPINEISSGELDLYEQGEIVK